MQLIVVERGLVSSVVGRMSDLQLFFNVVTGHESSSPSVEFTVAYKIMVVSFAFL